VAKTKAQIEKQKRDTEKRKKLEKTILRMAAAMPDEDPEQESTTPIPHQQSNPHNRDHS
jgi:hypothetical protein